MKRGTPELADHALWDEVRRTIAPLKGNKSAAADKSPKTKLSGMTGSPRPKPEQRRHQETRSPHVPPPLSAFDRRTAQRLSRGQLEPDARIDLHGHGLEVARMQLYHFLESQRRAGLKFVLVITGKGASPFARHTLHGTGFFHAPEREGRLRREVPLWLHETVFREHVSGLQPAHPRHGGGGAFYVRLRRMPEPWSP